MAKTREGVTLTYEKVQALTDLPINTLHQAATKPPPGKKRQHLNLGCLESVVLWLASHGKPELRKKICGLSASCLLDEGILPGVPRSGPRRKKRGA